MTSHHYSSAPSPPVFGCVRFKSMMRRGITVRSRTSGDTILKNKKIKKAALMLGTPLALMPRSLRRSPRGRACCSSCLCSHLSPIGPCLVPLAAARASMLARGPTRYFARLMATCVGPPAAVCAARAASPAFARDAPLIWCDDASSAPLLPPSLVPRKE